MEAKISVIVPVYNAERYLERCVTSIVNQTYQNIEIILVDDGSRDRSGEMCDLFAEKDQRIKVIHKENGGASTARNIGLDICLGEYVTFVDSDDWLDIHMYENLMELMENMDGDIVECNWEIIHDEMKDIKQPEIEVTVLKRVEAEKALFDGSGKATILPWNKIYKKKLFENNRFPEGMMCEDQWLLPKIYLKSKQSIYVNQKYYYYYQSPNSVMRSSFGKKNLAALVAFEETRKLYLENGLQDLVQWCDTAYSFLLIKYYNLSLKKLESRSIAQKIKGCFNKRLKEYLRNPHLNKKQKLLLIGYYIMPQLYKVKM